LNHQNNYAFYALYAGEFDTAQRQALAVRAQNPSFTKAYVALALSQLANGDTQLAADTYRKLEALHTPDGRYYARSGLADIALYEGRLTDAATIETDLAAGEMNASRKSKE